MNKEQFTYFMERPDLLNDESMPKLNALISEFPYFQTAHLLYLKNLHNVKSIHFSARLRIAAAYSPDRESLKNLILHYTQGTLPAKSKKIEKEEKPTEQNEVVLKEISEQERNILATLERFDKMPTQTQEVVAEKKNLFEIRSSTFAKVKETAKEEKETVLPPVEKKELVTDVKTLRVEEENKIIAVEETKVEIPTELPKSQSMRSFTEWLRATVSATDAKEENKTPENRNQRKSDKIISKFIVNEPKIERRKGEFYSAADKARESTTLNNSLITETLAKIFLKQGNLEKALESYENLSLRFPEKKATFAAQIKLIKARMGEAKLSGRKNKNNN